MSLTRTAGRGPLGDQPLADARRAEIRKPESRRRNRIPWTGSEGPVHDAAVTVPWRSAACDDGHP